MTSVDDNLMKSSDVMNAWVSNVNLDPASVIQTKGKHCMQAVVKHATSLLMLLVLLHAIASSLFVLHWFDDLGTLYRRLWASSICVICIFEAFWSIFGLWFHRRGDFPNYMRQIKRICWIHSR